MAAEPQGLIEVVERRRWSWIPPRAAVADRAPSAREADSPIALAAAASAGRTTPAPAILTLQRWVGNAAVAAALGKRRSMSARRQPTVQRYISAEHKELGEAASTRSVTLDLWVGPPEPVGKTRKVSISYGVANALLGDYYQDWAQLKKAPAPEVERLAALFQQEQTNRAAGKPGPTEAEYEQATAGRKAGAVQAGGATNTYLELAEENVDHFTAANREHFARQHKAALAKGVEAFTLQGQGKTREADAAATDAFGLNAEADHFLEDAFAAGHLVNKPLIQVATLAFWSGGIGRAAGDHLKAAAAKDQARIWRQIDAHVLPALGLVERIALRGMDRTGAINMVLDQILDRLQTQPDKLANLGAKLVHDHLNEVGVQVFSEADPATGWRTFGDSFMSKGATKAKVVDALKASVANVESAVATGLGQSGSKPADIDAYLKTNNPWRLAPKWAEVAATRREVGTALTDASWIHDLLKTKIFRDDVGSPLYLLLLDNLELVGTLLRAEQQAATQRRTQQALEVDKLLKKYSRSFAKGGNLKDVNATGLAAALRGKSADLFASVLDRLSSDDRDDNVAVAFAELHPSRATLVALDHAILLRMNEAMQGGVTWADEARAIDRVKTALIVKSGQRFVGQLPAKERAAAQKILKNLNAQGDQRAVQGEKSFKLVTGTRKDVWKPKDLAAMVKGQDAAVVLGVIDEIFFERENGAWLGHFAALHTDAEVAALDVGVLEAVTKRLAQGAHRRRFEKALKAAHDRGDTATAVPDKVKGSELAAKFRFTSYPKLAQQLKGKPPGLVDEVLGSLNEAGPPVAAEFTRQLSDDELAALDAGLLHRLTTILTDAGELSRTRKALSRSVSEAAKRSTV